MPYIPPANRPDIDARVEVVAEEIATTMIEKHQTAELSVHYRRVFTEMADFIVALERDPASPAVTTAQQLAATVFEKAKAYKQIGAWAGELNYALTMLIQLVPYKMFKKKAWEAALRYWIHVQTVGALTRTAYDLHARGANDYVGNALPAVFEDVKDELKRRVNSAYEAAQINASGDCYHYVPFRTQLTPFETAGTKGFIEIMLPFKAPE